MDTDKNGKLSADEIVNGTLCMNPTAETDFLRQLAPWQMTEAGAKVRAEELNKLLPSPEIFIPTPEQLKYSKQHDYGINSEGNSAPSTADTEKLDEDARHQGKKILRDNITFAKVVFTLWQPETVAGYQIAKGVINNDPDEIAGGVSTLLVSVAARNAGRPTRVETIHEAGGSPGFRDLAPTVRLETDQGVLVGRGPTQDLLPKQRKILDPWEDWVQGRPYAQSKLPHEYRVHPDIRIIMEARHRGWVPFRLEVAGREFCPECRMMIEDLGATIVSPFKAIF
jgi:hypothetical protein